MVAAGLMGFEAPLLCISPRGRRLSSLESPEQDVDRELRRQDIGVLLRNEEKDLFLL